MHEKEKHIAIIGAGAAGLEAASRLSKYGHKVSLFERSNSPGGHLKDWALLFPALKPAKDVLHSLLEDIDNERVQLIKEAEVTLIEPLQNKFYIKSNKGECQSDAVLITTGFDLFDAHRKEEYGYGIYENVITSYDLEEILSAGRKPLRRDGKGIKKIAFVHCVGSRDEKAGNIYCSKVCCITAVKQAIEVKKIIPSAEVYCFYMDLRMYGSGFEEMYKMAQHEYNIHFIRGRVSETCENSDSTIMVKAQDTMLGRQMKINTDLLVLMAGITPSSSGKILANKLGLEENHNGFLKHNDAYKCPNHSSIPGIFIAGSCKGPSSISETITDAGAAVVQIQEYLLNSLHNE